MNTNDVFVADSDSLAIDIACYEKLFADYIRRLTAEKDILPEITGAILAKYQAEPLSTFGTMLYAFVGGFEAGLNLAIEMDAKSNRTIIE